MASHDLKLGHLHQWHRDHGAVMGTFAGLSLPMSYGSALKEHKHTRQLVSLFDVTHMPQFGCYATKQNPLGIKRALSALFPVDLDRMPQGRCAYTMMLNEGAGVIDDMILSHMPTSDGSDASLPSNHSPSSQSLGVPSFLIVSNAGQRDTVGAHLHADQTLHHDWQWRLLDDRSLFALQGPKAMEILENLGGIGLSHMRSMTIIVTNIAGITVWISRTGYTGEDGFEISVDSHQAQALAQMLLANPDVALAGLIARDSLRLEAGFPLYGQELTPAIDPITAGLQIAIPKRSLQDAVFRGIDKIKTLINTPPKQQLIGLIVEGRAIARSTAIVLPSPDSTITDAPIGYVTSGGFSPILQQSIAMAYVDRSQVNIQRTGSQHYLGVIIRNKVWPAVVSPLPFIKKKPYLVVSSK